MLAFSTNHYSRMGRRIKSTPLFCAYSYLADKSDNVILPQWSSFIKRLYDSILMGKYQKGKIEFKVPLSKIQLFKLKKTITEAEKHFYFDIVNIGLHFFLKDVRTMLPSVMNHSIAVA